MQGLLRLLLLTTMGLASCNSPEKEPATTIQKPEEQGKKDLAALQKEAKNGDLVVRLSDDILSNQIRYLNETDKSYSHCGLIVEQGGQKYICHIAPEIVGADTIQFEPIDSFLNPEKHVKAALYRYNFVASEIDSTIATIHSYRTAGISFDRLYDLATNNKMYCSEMISKAIKKGTNDKVSFKEVLIPKKLKKMVEGYFAKEKGSKKIVSERVYIPIDGLYLIPQCRQIMAITLKYFPGQ